MDISVLTIFPEIFGAYFADGVASRGLRAGAFSLDVLDIREFTTDRHRKVDDYPFGGGPGMVMKPEPIAAALDSLPGDPPQRRVLMVAPSGRPFDQRLAEELSQESRRLVFISGRYEGIDQRIADLYADDEVSIGDYVLTGGELPVLVIIDAVVRLLPGVVGDSGSLGEESFSWGILDYPHYTRPAQWQGLGVPEVLLSGDHAKVDAFRRREAIKRTLRFRPDLLKSADLTEEDKKAIKEIKEDASESGQGR